MNIKFLFATVFLLALLASFAWALPDFEVDAQYAADTLHVDYVNSDTDPCLQNERCLAGTGLRKVLRFSTKVDNKGATDFFLGTPPANRTNPPAYWYWDTCHVHWHYTAYAAYALRNANATQVVLQGRKNGFCVEDVVCGRGSGRQLTYNCSYQGITAGCSDIYEYDLACQWIDITDLETMPGYTPSTTYILEIIVNPNRDIQEESYRNNIARIAFAVQDLYDPGAPTGQFRRPGLEPTPSPAATPAPAEQQNNNDNNDNADIGDPNEFDNNNNNNDNNNGFNMGGFWPYGNGNGYGFGGYPQQQQQQQQAQPNYGNYYNPMGWNPYAYGGGYPAGFFGWGPTGWFQPQQQQQQLQQQAAPGRRANTLEYEEAEDEEETEEDEAEDEDETETN